MSTDGIQFQQASLLDIPLFLHWLEQGAMRRIFNEELVTFVMQLQMYRQAAPATRVWRRTPSLPAVGGRTLLRARAQGETQGLVMLQRKGESDYVIEYIMVGDDFRPNAPKPLVFVVRFRRGTDEVEEAFYDVRP